MADEKTLSNLRADGEVIASYQHLSELPLVVAGAHGPYLTDDTGRDIIDITAGACTMNLGYGILKGEEYASFPFPYASGLKQVELAKRLARHYPCLKPEEVRVGFGVCGSEAIDGAIKLCRAFTGRKKIVTFEGDYHGTTLGSVALTTLPGRISDRFAPLLPEVYTLPFCDETASEEDIDECLLKLAYMDYETIAGFIIETVQGDMGMLPMHQRLMSTLYHIAKSWGIAFVVDEVQMAFYRTGPFFAIENYADVVPDAIVMGKSLGGGIPLSAIMGRKEFMDSLGPCEHAFSMAGNSEACARGLKFLDVIEGAGFRETLESRMMELYDGLQRLEKQHPRAVSHLTGIGFAFGLWIKSVKEGESDAQAAFKVMYRAFELGLYTMRLGANWLRIEPSLNIDREVLAKALSILNTALADYEAGRISDEVLTWMLK